MADAERYIGLMSGTSIDAVDAVLLTFAGDQPKVSHWHSEPIAEPLRAAITTLCLPGADGLDLLGETDHALGELFARAALALIAKAGLRAADITAIGSHGQTVRHRPDGARPFTLQIADPNRIAARTGLPTVADFRRMDMALGGQGAPLVPAFHRAVFHHPGRQRLVINIGGIANLTWIPGEGPVLGFDTGPGNGLMDQWIQRARGEPFDRDGAWAASGQVHQPLLARLLAHPFLTRPAPKSTGREAFNLPWLDGLIATLATPPSADEVMATLAAFTATSLRQAFALLPGQPDEIFLCGGGAANRHLVGLLGEACNPLPVATTGAMGIAPAQVEGAAFAWLARQTLRRQSGSLASVTGASRDAVLGALYLP